MCGFTVLNVKLLLFAFIFTLNTDYCLLATAYNDPIGPHTHSHSDNNLNTVQPSDAAHIGRVYDGGNVVDNVFFGDGINGVGVTNTTGNRKMDTGPLENVTLRVGYANDPFGVSPPEGALLPLHLRHSEEKTTKQQKTFKSASEENRAKRVEKTHAESRSRAKRGVVQLYNMVNCATGCDPLIYKGYGCYCGFLGSGYPVDGIDKCCKMHDICYDVANCPMYLEYVVPYYWKCHRGKSLCAIDHLDLGGSGSCAQRLCECDRLLSECLSRFPCPRRRAKCVSSPWRFLQNTLMFF